MASADEAPKSASLKYPGMSELIARADFIHQHTDLRERLIAAFLEDREQREPSIYVEQQIYDGFYSNDDIALMAAFHDVSWEERLELVGQFTDPRLRVFARRLVFLERPDLLNEEARHEHELEFAARLLASDEPKPWLTLAKALQEVEDFLAVADETVTAFLVPYRDYLQQRLEAATARLQGI